MPSVAPFYLKNVLQIDETPSELTITLISSTILPSPGYVRRRAELGPTAAITRRIPGAGGPSVDEVLTRQQHPCPLHPMGRMAVRTDHTDKERRLENSPHGAPDALSLKLKPTACLG